MHRLPPFACTLCSLSLLAAADRARAQQPAPEQPPGYYPPPSYYPPPGYYPPPYRRIAGPDPTAHEHDGLYLRMSIGIGYLSDNLAYDEAVLPDVTFSGGAARSVTHMATGVGLGAAIGQEWWVGSQWSIGVIGRLMYMHLYEGDTVTEETSPACATWARRTRSSRRRCSSGRRTTDCAVRCGFPRNPPMQLRGPHHYFNVVHQRMRSPRRVCFRSPW